MNSLEKILDQRHFTRLYPVYRALAFFHAISSIFQGNLTAVSSLRAQFLAWLRKAADHTYPVAPFLGIILWRNLRIAHISLARGWIRVDRTWNGRPNHGKPAGKTKEYESNS